MSTQSVQSRLRGLLRPSVWEIEAQPGTQSYLHGLRGVLALSSLLWIFFQTFVPSVVSHSTAGPTYQKVIRIVFSPVLWNESLISSFFFALSARAICVRFLNEPKSVAYAGSIIRRIIRMSIAVALASGIASGIFKGLGTSYVHTFKQVLPNNSIVAPDTPNNALTALNAMFDLFWVVRSYFYQAANDFWPSQTIWSLSLIYQQSWTIYFLMLILPYTRASWHWQFIAMFAFGSFWMNSWGWYDASALLLADYVINPKLRVRLDEGLSITKEWKLPLALPGAAMMIAGLAMKYMWTAFPRYMDAELVLHPYLDLAENTTRAQFAAADPYPRLDNYLVIFGALLMVETTPQIKKLLSARWLVALGRRSLSLFVAQSIVFWTAGIMLFLHLHGHGASTAIANLAVFVTCSLATFLFGEVYYRAVDVPSQWIASQAYSWLLR
ncbi:hypothetical protein LTR36_006860 [Oleoguttula mirabilis]|uniref:Uncharacterized protein n=1 Tax=Oleoguttula mirabilis TaxID=1507867 RepID=A0AAV9JBI4_9PEZI|nr:hypothetical protein LTR36_006860 [Oleoguttula mirabilis]